MLKIGLIYFCKAKSSTDVLDVMSIGTLDYRFTVNICITRNPHRFYSSVGKVGNKAEVG